MFQDRTHISGGSNRAPAVYKLEDESITNSTILHNDAELAVSLEAGFKYLFECVLFFENSGPLCRVAFTGDSILTANDIMIGIVGNGHPILGLDDDEDLISVTRPSVLVGYIDVATSGTMTLQWKQSLASGTTTLKSGSYLVAWRVN